MCAASRRADVAGKDG